MQKVFCLFFPQSSALVNSPALPPWKTVTVLKKHRMKIKKRQPCSPKLEIFLVSWKRLIKYNTYVQREFCIACMYTYAYLLKCMRHCNWEKIWDTYTNLISLPKYVFKKSALHTNIITLRYRHFNGPRPYFVTLAIWRLAPDKNKLE